MEVTSDGGFSTSLKVEWPRFLGGREELSWPLVTNGEGSGEKGFEGDIRSSLCDILDLGQVRLLLGLSICWGVWEARGQGGGQGRGQS